MSAMSAENMVDFIIRYIELKTVDTHAGDDYERYFTRTILLTSRYVPESRT